MNDKVIALIDMDCFYVQVTELMPNNQIERQQKIFKVEAREKPSLKGVPAAVVQVFLIHLQFSLKVKI